MLNVTVSRECSISVRQHIFATINGVRFIGCGGNRVSQVRQFIVENTIFQGVEGRGTALVLVVSYIGLH